MGPRKRCKPNPKGETESVPEEESFCKESKAQCKDSPKPFVGESVPVDKPEGLEPVHSSVSGVNTPELTKNWYGGTWPRGGKPVTQVAKESISAAGGAASEALASARTRTPELPITPLNSHAPYLSKTVRSSGRLLPLAATTTKLHITSDARSLTSGAADVGKTPKSERVPFREQKTKNTLSSTSEAERSKDVKLTNTPQTFNTRPEAKDRASEVPIATNETASWLSWFSKSEVTKEGGKSMAHPDGDSSSVDRNRPESTISEDLRVEPKSPEQIYNPGPSPVSSSTQQEISTRSWLSLWGTPSKPSRNCSSAGAFGPASNVPNESNGKKSQNDKFLDAAVESVSAPQLSQQPEDGTKSSYGWAFWSKDWPKRDDGKSRVGSEVGELALAGSSSQSKPKLVRVDEARSLQNMVGKRQGPQPLEAADDLKNSLGIADDAHVHSKPEVVPLVPNKTPKGDTGLKEKRMPENLLLPSFRSTYSTVQKTSLIQQISNMLQMSSSPEPRHVDVVQKPSRIKRALAIGVHGYFPAPLIRSILGQPTGTSIRFADGAASAIQRWAENQGYPCEVEKVALEGEGRIAERVDLLWKLMLNWIEKIRKTDFVMIACHSQGVPVAMMLVAKLIAFGCIHSAKIGVCAMAGVNLGPFADYKSRWISGSAGELFEFALPNSQVSKDYEAALDTALRFGVKVVYIGSIDDQLVSLESSTFGKISHPHIYRAVFIDGRVHAPDFLTHLVGFALKLRNLGIKEHGVIRELSSPLAGSLYSGEGHSRIYEDEAGYYLAVEYALETTSIGQIRPRFHHEGATTSQNPYILPFAMRGVLEEDYVRTELYGEITELIKQFDEWKPSTKALKDVKFRLEGVRSRL